MTATGNGGWAAAPAAPAAAAPVRAVEAWHCRRDGDTLTVTARLGVHGEDPNLRGHFPGLPILPGVFVIEAVCQAMALAAATALALPAGRMPALRRLRSARFLAPLLAGDQLTLAITATPAAGGWSVRAQGTRADGTVAARIRADFDARGAGDA